MKKLLFALAVAACSVALTAPKDAYDIKPEVAKPTEALSSVEWETKNDVVLKTATADDVIAAFVTDAESAAALLAQVKGAYDTDPLVACQVAAVTQWVMIEDHWYWLCFDGPRVAGRKVWVSSLIKTVKESKDDYVRVFCLDQLRWCACPSAATRIAEAVGSDASKAVRDFAAVVVRELEGKVVK